MKKTTVIAGTIIMSFAAAAGAADDSNSFVGSLKCRECHVEEYNSWKDSFHTRIIRPKKGGILKGAAVRWKTDGTDSGPAKGNVTGATFTLDDVQYVVGSKWKQRYLVKNDQTGNLQFMDKQYNLLSGKWESYDQKNDWNTICASCHTTGYRITRYDSKTKKTTGSEFSELGVGCEACHGQGAKHISAKDVDRKKTIFNPANVDIVAQSKVCGYCHVKVQTEAWLTAQGNPREDMPAPKPGETYRPGDDWTKWPDIIMPGLQAEYPFDKEYTGELKGVFKVDAYSKANGIYEEGMHHQQYQGFVQSAHYKSGKISCITCHVPHAGKGKLKKLPKDACKACHDASYTVDKYMPNTGETTGSLFVRSHTFSKKPRQGDNAVPGIRKPNHYE